MDALALIIIFVVLGGSASNLISCKKEKKVEESCKNIKSGKGIFVRRNSGTKKQYN